MGPNEIADLASRWQRARRSALKTVAESESPGADVALASVEAEGEALRDVSAESIEKRLRDVFDNSRKLALSASKYFGVTFEIDDFRSLFVAAGVPCAQGIWERRDGAAIGTRNGCPMARVKNTHACDWYREAMDGLVMGLGQKERIVRHGSEAYGDSACVDVLFEEGPSAATGVVVRSTVCEGVSLPESSGSSCGSVSSEHVV